MRLKTDEWKDTKHGGVTDLRTGRSRIGGGGEKTSAL